MRAAFPKGALSTARDCLEELVHDTTAYPSICGLFRPVRCWEIG
jgi:hypothetical protein